MLAFGSGVLIATPAGGTPINFGILQGVTIDETAQMKNLFGAYNYPAAVAAGERTVTLKATSAHLSAAAVGLLFNNVAPIVGTQYLQLGEAVPTSNTGSYTATNSATWIEDQGVVYAATGVPLQLITTGSPTLGQYKVAAGVYTFNTNDPASGLLVNYAYSVAATGRTVQVVQQLMGPMTYFSARLYQTDPQTGLFYGVKLYNCASSKLTHATKVGDWTIPEFDASVFANAAGRVMDKFYADAF